MSKLTLFDLRDHSSVDLERLEMAINSGVKDFQEVNMPDVAETVIAWRNLVNCAKRLAIEKESEAWAAKTSKEISEGTL